MSSTSLYTRDKKIEIPLFNKDYKYFLNKSIVLYGTSNSGKSFIMRDILYILKDHIPNCVVICGTNDLNKSYSDIIPSQLIHQDVTQELIQKILVRQKMAVKMYNLVNDLHKLQVLYAKMPYKYIDKLKILINGYNIIKDKLENNDALHIVEKKMKLQELENEHEKTLINFYKQTIHKNKNSIDSTKFDELEIKMINYININPNFMIIIDDLATTAHIWSKFQEIVEAFFNGRHYKLTFMISFQNDKKLNVELRKNAFINIFTTAIECNSFFQRSNNNFTMADKKKASAAADIVFNDNNKSKNYKKLMYIKDLDPDFYYIIGEYRDEFKIGSQHLHSLCNKVKKNNNTNEEDWSEFKGFF